MVIFSYGNLQAKITNNSERTKYPAMFFWIKHKQKAGCKADNVTRTRAGHPDKACFIVLSRCPSRDYHVTRHAGGRDYLISMYS